jgi:CHASE3 domain sensor protein
VGAKHAIAEKAWSYLADEQNPKHAIDLERLSYFDEPEKTIAMRQKRTKEVVDALISLESGGRLTKKVVSGRYTSGLPSVSAKARNALRWELEQHL